MSGRCISKINCPKCSKHTLQIFHKDGEDYTGYCFNPACATYFDDPYNGDAPRSLKEARTERSPEELAQELEEVKALPGASLPARKLSKEALAHFGVKMAVSEEDGTTPVLAYFPLTNGNSEPVAYKVKLQSPKKMWCMGAMKDIDMFGWQQALQSGAPKLFVTEGEEDAVALWQVLKENAKGTKWEELVPAVVSLSAGASSARRDLTRNLQTIRQQFKEVVLVFDMDDAGRAAIKEAMHILPEAQATMLPCKDANECLIQGRSKALIQAVLWKAATPKNTRIIDARSLFIDAKKPAVPGLSWPWKGLTDLTKGMRLGEVSYFGAAPKMGKSELVNALSAHWIKEHGLKVFLAKPEEANNKTIKMVLGKIAARKFDDPDVPFDEEAYDKAAELVDDRLLLLDLYQHVNYDTFEQDLIAAASDGAKVAVLDPLTNFVGGLSNSEANTHLQDIAQRLAATAKDHNMHIHVFCHLRNPDQGPPHERGGKVLSSQFAGSRGMARHCHLMFGLEGNRDPDLPEEQRNIRKLVLLEDREFGSAGSIDLYWNSQNAMFNPI